MINDISVINEYSILEQGTLRDIIDLNRVQFEEKELKKGGFGSVYSVLSLNGLRQQNLLVKILRKQENNQHAYDSIRLLHNKLKRKYKNDGIPTFLNYPELLGLPFIAFKAYDEINSELVVGLIMYDLTSLGYSEYSSDHEIQIPEAITYSYKLSKVVGLLHELNFLHSDLKSDAIFINEKTKSLSIIDFDSGYHFEVQEKPITAGTIVHWTRNVGQGIKNLIGLGKDKRFQELKAEEEWILINAIFQFFTNIETPYFFLKEADKSIKQKYLKKYKWPEYDEKFKYSISGQIDQVQKLNSLLELFHEIELSEIVRIFEKSFNEGYNDNKELSAAKELEREFSKILFELDTKPNIKFVESSIDSIDKPNQQVTFSWSGEEYKFVKINGKNSILFSSSLSLQIANEGPVILEFVGDIITETRQLFIKANKKIPKINLFEASTYFRDSLMPITIFWQVEDAEKIIINSKEQVSLDDSISVEPTDDTSYVLTALGYFGEIATEKIKITVLRPEIEEFFYEINLEHGIDNVDLFWKTKNATSIEINPHIGDVESIGKTPISIQGATQFTLIAKGFFGSVAKVLTAKPFPVPIITELMVQYPQIEINATINAPRVQIPDPLRQLTNIKFSNNIEYHPVTVTFTELEAEFNLESHFSTFNSDEDLKADNLFNSALKKVKSQIKKKLKI